MDVGCVVMDGEAKKRCHLVVVVVVVSRLPRAWGCVSGERTGVKVESRGNMTHPRNVTTTYVRYRMYTNEGKFLRKMGGYKCIVSMDSLSTQIPNI